MPAPRDPATIAARATPPGRGGIGIIRLSGPAVPAIAARLLGDCPPPRTATLRAFRDADGSALDTGLALYFPAPHSFTGEDVLELHAHGGAVLLELLLERVLSLGARLARPGEFSERAFLNDKLDLVQAEAVADLIDAGSRAAARAAQRSLAGAFSEAILGLNERVTDLRMYVEAAIDFPEEEIDFLAGDALRERLDAVAADFGRIEAAARQGRLLRDGVQVVLAGRPNSGKSSLLNRLAGYSAAIVTAIPGTTRDPVREAVDLDGLVLHFVDTAGLRHTADPVEREGVTRTRNELATADLALLVVDANAGDDDAPLRAELPPGIPAITVRNKIDLTAEQPGMDAGTVRLSALTGEGLGALRDAIRTTVGYAGPEEGSILARQRHLDVIRRARQHFDTGRQWLTGQQAGELLAEELRAVQKALAEITGEFSSDDLLGRIFAGFCIGK
ncbi:MAG: tRNA uridine-5-carboxymethylaminomethyl(34) synthesis GTPase MnmE [Gammaproteobacteria bacterium]|nr:tRNA uridine-5-carboxymethylaminomethyl(34) synthesis GTPase MnmE [Gammaproteobacteria bacterium]